MRQVVQQLIRHPWADISENAQHCTCSICQAAAKLGDPDFDRAVTNSQYLKDPGQKLGKNMGNSLGAHTHAYQHKRAVELVIQGRISVPDATSSASLVTEVSCICYLLVCLI